MHRRTLALSHPRTHRRILAPSHRRTLIPQGWEPRLKPGVESSRTWAAPAWPSCNADVNPSSVYGKEGFMRICTLALSVIAHLLVLTLVVVIPLFATDVLPEPHRAIEFVDVMPVVVPPPPPILRAREQSQPDTAPSNVAPLEEPQGVAPEPEPAIAEPFDVPPSLVDGIAFGDDSLVRDPAPPPPPRERDPVRVGGSITRPERVRYVPPVYPDVARAARIEGTVILEAVIGTDGTVREVRVLRPLPFLEAAAVEAVQQWLFTPTLLNGEPVPVVMTVTVTFTLR